MAAEALFLQVVAKGAVEEELALASRMNNKQCWGERRMVLGINKKGEVGAEEWLEQIPYIILTLVVMIGIFLLINYFVNLNVDVRDVEVGVLANRILYSPGSIMFTDPVTGQVYPGIISMANFTNEALDTSINYSSERHIAAKLTLYDKEMKPIRTIYLNEKLYTRLEPLAENWISGLSSGKLYVKAFPVVYRAGDVDFPGFLRMKIIIPNN